MEFPHHTTDLATQGMGFLKDWPGLVRKEEERPMGSWGPALAWAPPSCTSHSASEERGSGALIKSYIRKTSESYTETFFLMPKIFNPGPGTALSMISQSNIPTDLSFTGYILN